MDAIIIFVRVTIWSSVIHIYDGSDKQSDLFSGSVAAFIIDDYRMLSSDSDDMTAADGIRVETLSPPDTFQPNLSTLRVNAFSFLSLIFDMCSSDYPGQAMGA